MKQIQMNPWISRLSAVGLGLPVILVVVFHHWYSASTYRAGDSDPKGPASGGGRVLRGGSWAYHAFCCRFAHRHAGYPGGRYFDFGFRLARNPGP